MIWALLAACEAPPDSPAPHTGGEDSAAETTEDGPAEAVTLVETGMATVFRVTWTTDEPTVGRVVFEDGDGRARASAWDDTPTTDHEALLLGMLPDHEIPWRVETVADDVTWPGVARTLTTGTLPTSLPELTVTDLDPDRAAVAWTITPIISPTGGWIVILDEEGRYIWAWPAPATDTGGWQLVFRARLGLDGDSLVYNHQSPGLEQFGTLGRLALDGESRGIVGQAGMHTDFVELPGGRWATLGWSVRDYDGRSILGDTVFTVEADGSTNVLWDVFDDFEPDLSEVWPAVTLNDYEGEDWSHVNSIDVSEDGADLLVTASFNHALMRIDGDGAGLSWTVAEEGASDWTIDDADRPLLGLPHSVQDLGDGRYLVFNRGDYDANPSVCSSADELWLDEATGQATKVWSYTPEDCLFNAFLGDAWRLDGWNTFVDFSAGGRIDEVTPEGALVSRLTLSAGAGFGFGERVAPLR